MTTNSKNNDLVKISECNAEMKKERGSINQALRYLLTYAETCPSVKKVTFTKEFAMSCASQIYADMKIGEEYTVNVTNKETKEKEQVTRVRKPSSHLCLRWFVANQEANAIIYEGRKAKKAKKGNTEDKAAEGENAAA